MVILPPSDHQCESKIQCLVICKSFSNSKSAASEDVGNFAKPRKSLCLYIRVFLSMCNGENRFQVQKKMKTHFYKAKLKSKNRNIFCLVLEINYKKVIMKRAVFNNLLLRHNSLVSP